MDGPRRGLTLTAKGERVWQRVMLVVERRNAEIVSVSTPPRSSSSAVSSTVSLNTR